jgi:hypothetical protein
MLAQQRLLQHEADGLVIIYDPNRLHVVGHPMFFVFVTVTESKF